MQDAGYWIKKGMMEYWNVGRVILVPSLQAGNATFRLLPVVLLEWDPSCKKSYRMQDIG
jgi:hypothetical protein